MASGDDLLNHVDEIPVLKTNRLNCKRLSSTSREIRVKAEKERRDRLKNYMDELTTLVPAISKVTKRPDKTSILRLSANCIMLNHYFRLESLSTKCCVATWPENIFQFFNDVLEDVYRAFLIAIFPSGKLLYVSESVEKILGYNQVDMLNDTLFRFVPDEDLPHFKENLSDCSPGKKHFNCRLVEKGLSRSDPGRLINMNFEGYFRNFPSESKTSGKAGKPKDQQVFQDFLFIGMVFPVKEDIVSQSTMLNATKEEYFTRHHIDGRILETDHRISLVTGYLVQEVTGNQALDYMVPEDRIWSEMNLKVLITSETGIGVTTYRLLGPSKNIVCLRTRGFLERNETSMTLLCINTPLNWEEAKSEMMEQRQELVNAGLIDPSALNNKEKPTVQKEDIKREEPNEEVKIESNPSSPPSSPTPSETQHIDEDPPVEKQFTFSPEIMYLPMSPKTLDTVLLTKALSSKENIATKVVHWYPGPNTNRLLCQRDVGITNFDLSYRFCEPYAKVPCSSNIVSLEDGNKIPLTSVTNIINRTSMLKSQGVNK